jgi:N-carbamoylputrescine amidase
VAPRLITATGSVPPSLARVEAPSREPLRVGLVQERWHPEPEAHEAALAEGIAMAAGEGALLVCLQELTLSPYFAVTEDALDVAAARAEPIPEGPTTRLAARCATEHGIHVHASLYERAEDGGLGYNTAIVVGPGGEVVARTRTGTSGRATAPRAIPWWSWGRGASASRPAGTSGSPSWPGRTRSAGRR